MFFFCPFVFCPDITLFKCLKGLKSQKSHFVSKFLSGGHSLTKVRYKAARAAKNNAINLQQIIQNIVVHDHNERKSIVSRCLTRTGAKVGVRVVKQRGIWWWVKQNWSKSDFDIQNIRKYKNSNIQFHFGLLTCLSSLVSDFYAGLGFKIVYVALNVLQLYFPGWDLKWVAGGQNWLPTLSQHCHLDHFSLLHLPWCPCALPLVSLAFVIVIASP